MKATTIILSVFAAIAAVQAAPPPLAKRGVNTGLVPSFGIKAGHKDPNSAYVSPQTGHSRFY